jgi:hypothetical protein
MAGKKRGLKEQVKVPGQSAKKQENSSSSDNPNPPKKIILNDGLNTSSPHPVASASIPAINPTSPTPSTAAGSSGSSNPITQPNLTSKPKPIIVDATLQTVINYIQGSAVKLSMSDVALKVITAQQKKQVMINPTTIEIKDKIIQLCVRHQLNYHSYTEQSEKKAVFVLKGYDVNATSVEILQTLNDAGIPALKVTTIVESTENRRAVHLVTFEKDAINIASLNHNHRNLAFVRVFWEHQLPKDKQITQCHRCQQWGHSSFNCGRPSRCAKCGENHSTESCSRPKKKDLTAEAGPPKCANCGGEHTANYRNCEVAKKYAQTVKPKVFRSPPLNAPRDSNQGYRQPVNANELDQQFPILTQQESQRNTVQPRLESARRQPSAPHFMSYEQHAWNQDLHMDHSTSNSVSFSQIPNMSNRLVEMFSTPGFSAFLETFFSFFMRIQSANTAEEKNLIFAEGCALNSNNGS